MEYVIATLIMFVLFASGVIAGSKINLFLIQHDLRKRTRDQWPEYCDSILEL